VLTGWTTIDNSVHIYAVQSIYIKLHQHH